MTRASVLFVDDDANVLAALKNQFFRQRATWHMAFACGGQAALVELATRRFDVVVSDMRMPNVDGEALVNEIRARDLASACIILSGQSDPVSYRRMQPLIDAWLAKPCGADELRAAIASALQREQR